MTEKKHAKSSPADSRAALLEAAKRVFAEKGYEGATVKDLADEAGVNISMVSYYFGGKEGLYRTCLEGFGQERVAATERVLKGPSSKEDFVLRLRLFAESFIDINRSEPHICKIVQRAFEVCDSILMDLFHSVFSRIFDGLHNFVINAQKGGFVRGELDTEITTSLLFGSLMQTIRADELRRQTNKKTLDDPAYRDKVIEHWVQNHTQGIFSEETPKKSQN